MKKIFTYILLSLMSVATWGAPVYPGPAVITQSDGTQLTVLGYGDEDFHYYTTTDGVLLVHEGTDFFVAEVDGQGELKSTTQLAHEPSLRTVSEQQLASRQDMSRFMQYAQREQPRRAQKREPISGGTLFPHMGTPKAVVILVDFPDCPFTLPDPKASFEPYLNSMSKLEDLGNRENANVCSVAYYFNKISGGLFVPQFDVYGPVTLDNNLSYYGGSESSDPNHTGSGENMDDLLKHACQKVDAEVDFTQYDSNNDGKVDLVYVIYAGYSQSYSQNSVECIWPKSGTVSAGKFDGKTVSRYGVNNELNGFPGSYSSQPYERINGIGLFIHEFSHCMGLPDFYPVPTSKKENNQSMETWSVMDYGNYLQNGHYPCAYTAWEREAFGWTTIEDLTETTALELKPLDAGGKAYRIYNDNNNSKNEYYIIENIQKSGFNAAQKGQGLLVYHVDYDASLFSLGTNHVNSETGHPRMAVVPADGLCLSNKYINGTTVKNADYYAQLAGDPFPGTSNVTMLDDASGLPNFQVYTGTGLNKGLYDIEENDGVVTLQFINDVANEGMAHFEDIALEPESFINGAGMEGEEVTDAYGSTSTKVELKSGGYTFTTLYNPAWGSWSGYAISNQTSTEFNDYEDQYHSCVGSGYGGSSNYAVVYPSAYGETAAVNDPAGKKISGMYVTNSANNVKAYTEGDGMTPGAFTTGDWCLLTVTGTLTDDTKATTSVYLADYRSSVESDHYYIDRWQWVSLAELGTVKDLTFNITSSRNNDWGMTTPGYFCMDNLGGTPDETSGICQPTIANYNGPTRYYSIDGRQQDGLTRGINIIRMGDGTWRKVLKH
ncbi:MAG: M6 family metalloprotease domain-containing protein [Prevotella sp.]|nr:M6 family metalloprotease domain-containing protein [Prevotella sp.]